MSRYINGSSTHCSQCVQCPQCVPVSVAPSISPYVSNVESCSICKNKPPSYTSYAHSPSHPLSNSRVPLTSSHVRYPNDTIVRPSSVPKRPSSYITPQKTYNPVLDIQSLKKSIFDESRVTRPSQVKPYKQKSKKDDNNTPIIKKILDNNPQLSIKDIENQLLKPILKTQVLKNLPSIPGINLNELQKAIQDSGILDKMLKNPDITPSQAAKAILSMPFIKNRLGSCLSGPSSWFGC